MKFTLSWLKDHLETTATLSEIVETLTAIGLELESLENPAEALEGLVIARIEEAKPHPNADKLQLCQVDAGQGPVQIVCGAHNARGGMHAVLATPGTHIPGLGIRIKKGEIRGEASHGMLCSEKELELSDDHAGIIELPEAAPVGASYAEWAGLDDPVIEINLTPNRGDCAGVRGIARDLSAAGLGILKPNRPGAGAGSGASPTAVEIATSPVLCPVFAYRWIRGVRNGPSPDWLQRRLRAIGQRPISALVDITNLMTLDQNRPMHVFDVATLKGNLVVREAQTGEKLLALNGKEYVLSEGMVVISDAGGPVSLAGIMGGETTGCTEQTTDVLVESAMWCPVNIANTGRRLDLHSDARFRFERGVDPEGVVPGLEIASQLILDMCGGELGDITVAGQVPTANQTLTFSPQLVAQRTGMVAEPDQDLQILESLGFAMEPSADGPEQVTVRVPSWRTDIQGDADLVEEIARIRGYDKIPAVTLDRPGPLPPRVHSDLAMTKNRARRALAAHGLLEAVTWSFLPSTVAQRFSDLKEELFLQNPMSAELNYMRPSLLVNLIMALGRNADRGFHDVGLFEVGTVFHGVRPEDQPQCVAAASGGQKIVKHWSSEGRDVTVFDAREDAEVALRAAGAPDNLRVIPDAPSFFHPGRSGGLVLGQRVLAHFGEIHPQILDTLEVRGPVVGMEAYLQALPPRKANPKTMRPLLVMSAFQPVERDFAFLVDVGIAAADVLRAAASADKKLITQTRLFDVYAGKGVPEGKKSLAISVTLQPLKGSLTDSELDAIADKIVAAVAKSTGGTLRA